MKLFVTGVNGMLGHDVMKEIFKRGYEGTGCGTKEAYNGVADDDGRVGKAYVCLDITDEKAVNEVLEREKPDAVIHCAAWSAVDAAEKPENRARVEEVNVGGTANIARACRKLGCKMIYVSTEYVFDGSGDQPRTAETEPSGALNVYGRTKAEGERVVREILDKYYIVRIAWGFGINGNNFVRIMLNVGKTHDEVRVVNDQVGNPTYMKDLARLLLDMAERDRYGVYHGVNEGEYVSRYDFCREIYRQYGLKTKVIPVTTAEYGGNGAERPLNGRLDKSKLAREGFKPLPDWKDALGRYLKEMKEYDR